MLDDLLPHRITEYLYDLSSEPTPQLAVSGFED